MILHDPHPDIETSSLEYAKRFSGDAGRFFLEVQRTIILEELSQLGGKGTILDIGGGHGQVLSSMLASGYQVTILSSHSSACSDTVKKEVNKGNVEIVCSGFTQLPFEDNQYDAVIALRLLPHIEQWGKLLAEMRRVSKKMILFDYPDIRSFNFLYNFLFEIKRSYEKNTRPFSLFSRKQIFNILNQFEYRKINFTPQFFIPMVVHRKADHYTFSKWTEAVASACGLTGAFGSPVICSCYK